MRLLFLEIQPQQFAGREGRASRKPSHHTDRIVEISFGSLPLGMVAIIRWGVNSRQGICHGIIPIQL
jgi:hypothetical protein